MEGPGRVRRPLIVIEHLEDHFSRWLRAEYRHAAEMAGDRLYVTNAGCFCSEISRVVGREHCFRESILELQGVLYTRPERVIVLDPRAGEELSPGTASGAEALVVGGILGDHPPRGRTWEALTRRALEAGMRAAHLGEGQLSIDGAVYVALQVAEGRRVSELSFVDGLSVEVDLGDGFVREVVLPFRYPVVGGKPLVSGEVLELLRSGLGYEEYLEASGRVGGCSSEEQADEQRG